MGYDYAYAMEEFLDLGLPMLFSTVPSFLFGIAAYVLTALALYTVAQRRGLKNPWLAWIPVADDWLLGSISDQYRYLVRGENRSKRKILLILRILSMVLAVVMLCMAIGMTAGIVTSAIRGVSEEELIGQIMGPILGLLGVYVPTIGITIAYIIIRYMALYDIYRSLDPKNSVLFLVLSILINVTEPFFLFFSRNRDDGMPPRKQQPVYREPVYQQIPEASPTREEMGPEF